MDKSVFIAIHHIKGENYLKEDDVVGYLRKVRDENSALRTELQELKIKHEKELRFSEKLCKEKEDLISKNNKLESVLKSSYENVCDFKLWYDKHLIDLLK